MSEFLDKMQELTELSDLDDSDDACGICKWAYSKITELNNFKNKVANEYIEYRDGVSELDDLYNNLKRIAEDAYMENRKTWKRGPS